MMRINGVLEWWITEAKNFGTPILQYSITPLIRQTIMTGWE